MTSPCSAALNASGAGNPYTIGTARPDLHFGQMRELPRFFALRAPIGFLPRSDGRYVHRTKTFGLAITFLHAPSRSDLIWSSNVLDLRGFAETVQVVSGLPL